MQQHNDALKQIRINFAFNIIMKTKQSLRYIFETITIFKNGTCMCCKLIVNYTPDFVPNKFYAV